MTWPLTRSPRLTERLGFRLALSVALALVPVAAIVLVQSLATQREALARSEAALAGETLRAAELQILTIRKAQGAAESLALALAQILPDRERCNVILSSIVSRSYTYSFAGFYSPDGTLVCQSEEQAAGPRGGMREPPVAQSAPDVDVVTTTGSPRFWVVRASHPVYADTGELMGLVTLAVPHTALKLRARDGMAPLSLMTFNDQGVIVTSSVDLDAAASQLPADYTLVALAKAEGRTFTGLTRDGTLRAFSVTPIIPQRLYAIGTWPAGRQSLMARTSDLPPMVLALLVALGGLLASWVMAERLVVRHIRQLRNAMRSFATGSRVVRNLDFADAPLELRDVADSYEQMTDTILHDEAELEDMLHQKEVLLREVHHRVKNNLQLIASIMNMQIRQAKTPEVRRVMRSLQDRVMSLATIHRGLYQTTGLTDIRADELLAEIVRHIVVERSGPAGRLHLTTHFDDIRLTPDQAVPLALLLTEALTDAVATASADAGHPALSVTLERQGPFGARLTVRNSMGEPFWGDGAQRQNGLGRNLASAFAQQLDGSLEITQTDGVHTLTADFDLVALAAAEQRAESERAT